MTRAHICRTCAAWATEPGDGVEFPCHRHPAVEQPMKLADDWCLDWVAIQVPKELNSTEGKKPPGEWRPFKTAPRDGAADDLVRVVLSSLREPTAAMVKAGLDNYEFGGRTPKHVADDWRAMVDEALR